MDRYGNQAPKIYVAPDGSRIQNPHPPATAYATRPPASPTPGYVPVPPPSTAPGGSSQINVGLLVWGSLLIAAGFILIFAPLLGPGTFQGLVVACFAAIGIAFLILAYTTTRSTKQDVSSYTAPTSAPSSARGEGES